jgi:hypothetical protein
MAGVMAGQAALVMNGSGVNLNNYRLMMGTINSNIPGIAANVMNGQGMNSTFMTGMKSQMQSQFLGEQGRGGFTNITGMFRNMTSYGSFWRSTGNPMTPMSGGISNNGNPVNPMSGDMRNSGNPVTPMNGGMMK